MASFYFSTQGNDTTGDGSQGNPWRNFKGKKNGVGALVAGDSCFFNRGDVWIGSSAEVNVESAGSAGNFIVLAAYGTGSQLPTFCSAGSTVTGWTATGVSSIYTLTNQTQTNLYAVTQDDDKGLDLWRSTSSTLGQGTFLRVASTLYVHCWNNSDPSVSSVRIGNFTQTVRGLVRSGSTTSAFVQFNSLGVLCANGNGMTTSAQSCNFMGCTVIGAGNDGVMFVGFAAASENGAGSRWIGGDVSYSPCRGDGQGQGVTVNCQGSWVLDANIHDNFMAGLDFLADSNVNSFVDHGGALRNIIKDNSRSLNTAVFDPGLYNDGANTMFYYGNIISGPPANKSNGNSKSVFAFGSEHADVRQCHDMYIINNLIFGSHWEGLEGKNAQQNTNNIVNVTIVNNTIISNLPGTFDMCWQEGQHQLTSGNWVMRNNIFISGSNGTQGANLSVDTSSYLSADRNLYWQIGGGNTHIFQTNSANTPLSFAQWQSATLQDLNSVRTDPLLTTVNNTNPDVHLGANSPAIQMGFATPFTVPSWLPADLFPYGGGVRGVARSDGTVDPGAANLDLGYHYLSNASSAVIPPVPSSVSFLSTKLSIGLNLTLNLSGG